jgi:hypothetical protein
MRAFPISAVSPGAAKQLYFSSFETHNGKFRPFGVKDYMLHERLSKLGVSRPAIASLLNALREVLFTYSCLIIVVPVYVIYATVALYYFGGDAEFKIISESISYSLALVAIAMNMPILIEQVIGYAVLGDYAQYFHMLRAGKTRSSQFVAQMKVVLTIVLGVVATSTSGFLCVMMLFCGITAPTDFQWKEPSALNLWKLLVYSGYFATTTISTTGYGDIHPQNTLGRIVVILVHVICFFLIAFALSFFWSKSGSET